MVSWLWVLVALCFGMGIGMLALALCHAAAEWRHERRGRNGDRREIVWNSTLNR